MSELNKIPVIDLFAGPGGLGEGFSSITKGKKQVFNIKLSIEKDENAQRTLELRSFFRQFNFNDVPEEYYKYIKQYNPKTDKEDRKVLFDKYPTEGRKARGEAWKWTLGNQEYPDSVIDKRIEKALQGNKTWVLIGGPPCQAYSLVGRSRNKGISEEDNRVFLYREYLRIISVHHPAVFVMENVKGLLSAKLDGDRIFEWIKKDLKNPGRVFPKSKSPKYKIYSLVKETQNYDRAGNPVYSKDEDFLIRTESYGIPQNRHRVILLGIREDLGKVNFNPLKPSGKVKLKDVISGLPKLRSVIGREISGINRKEKNTYRKIEDTDSVWWGIITEYFQKLYQEFNGDLANIKKYRNLTRGTHYIKSKRYEPNNPLFEWYNDNRLNGVLNHETRSHLKEDLGRYLFSSIYLKQNGDFPKLQDYPNWLLPNHKNAKGGKFADRFRTQRPNQPATTITSHISKDGHYFIHYDSAQCRSLTVREAARIQTFPDNYLFCGARTHQFHQVGNAVPPFLAKQIGEIVKEILMNNE